MADTLAPPPEDGGRIVDEPLSEALSSRYLAYALSTITQRALPDVRDGLKPVQRRILYAMRELKLDPASGHKKSARVVGDVIGRFHPHGEQSIYDALVRLAQDFAQRYPLVDGHGNFGNIDGDNAAAMRYTEAKLTPAANALLEGLDADAVDFRATYDGEDDEPVVLPAAFPNLLANGATGIAVGMATSIPPHNAFELITAARALIKDPLTSVKALVDLVPGPDFPTGGVIVESRAAIEEAYVTGRGGFRVRARWSLEDAGRGTWRIVVTEVPYQVQKSKLIERIAELMELKKLPFVGDIRDESAEDVRLIIEPKSRTVDPEMLMESLFRQCDLETRFPLNLNVLDATGTPRVMSLGEALRAFLDHRREGLIRRSRKRLEKIADRLEVLAAYLVAYLNIDVVIRIIREEDEPKAELMRVFDLSDRQAEAILNMRLRSLRQLEEMEIRGEEAALREERERLNALVDDPARQWSAIDAELIEAAKIFGPATALGRRRSTFGAAPTGGSVAVEALVAREPITVVLSQKGWIRALKGKLDGLDDVKFKDGDEVRLALACETTDKVIVFATDGRAYALRADLLPGGRGHGEPIRLHAELPEGHEPVALFALEPGAKRLVASTTGRGFVVADSEFDAAKRNGKQILVLDPREEAAVCAKVAGDHVACLGENKKLLVFPLIDLPEMGRGKGVKLQTLRDGALSDLTTFAAAQGLAWLDAGGRTCACADWREWLGKRAGAGKPQPRGFPRSGLFKPYPWR